LPTWAPTRLREALQLLCLDWPPTDETLVTAWRKAALEAHPDRGCSHKAFVAVEQAREVVEEALKRGLPKAPSGGGRDESDDDEHDSHAAAAYGRFRCGMRRSQRGNLWRSWGGLTVTVFAKRGGWHFCISEDDVPTWSRPWSGWPSEEKACEALWAEVRRWAD
jgi:hypothetical protein